VRYCFGVNRRQHLSDPIERLEKLASSSGGMTPRAFRSFVRAFFRQHGRELPWRTTRDPYRIVVSEFMLQQTQAERVVPKYAEFLARFPTWSALADASAAQVMQAWRGLGYYRRAFNLHRAAKIVVCEHRGKLPRDPIAIRELPGVGDYTAGAVAAFAFGIATPIVETNIRAVFLHAFFPKEERVSDRDIVELVDETLDRKNPRDWYYALMDLGSELKRKRRGINRRSKHHVRQSPYRGSNREARAAILKALAGRGALGLGALRREANISPQRLKRALDALVTEGLVVKGKGARLMLP